MGNCVSTNYIPDQPPHAGKCAWLKTATETITVVSWVHTSRCTSTLNGTIVQSGNATAGPGARYKYCAEVGDAFYTVIDVIKRNLTTYDQCKADCDANAGCSACTSDGHECTLLTTFSTGGYDAWFRLDF